MAALRAQADRQAGTYASHALTYRNVDLGNCRSRCQGAIIAVRRHGEQLGETEGLVLVVVDFVANDGIG